MYTYCQYIFYGHIIMTVADPGGGGGSSPLFLDQTEVPGAEKILFGTSPPPPPPAPYLRAWLSGPPLIWRSGSATESLLSLKDLFLKDTPVEPLKNILAHLLMNCLPVFCAYFKSSAYPCELTSCRSITSSFGDVTNTLPSIKLTKHQKASTSSCTIASTDAKRSDMPWL